MKNSNFDELRLCACVCSFFLPVCLSVYLSIYLSVCLSVSLSLSLSPRTVLFVLFPSWKIMQRCAGRPAVLVPLAFVMTQASDCSILQALVLDVIAVLVAVSNLPSDFFFFSASNASTQITFFFFSLVYPPQFRSALVQTSILYSLGGGLALLFVGHNF